MAINWFKYSSPASFYFLAGKLTPIFSVTALILFVAGLYISFFVAPTDFQQSEAYRIIFIHVPAACRPASKCYESIEKQISCCPGHSGPASDLSCSRQPGKYRS